MMARLTIAMLTGALCWTSRALQAQSPSPEAMMRNLTYASRMAMMTGAAAELGLADLVAAGPRTAEDLAKATNTHGPSLYRVLRALASQGIFAEDEAGRFGLTPAAELLRTGAPGSLRAAFRRQITTANWHSVGNLLYSLQTGQPAFEHAHRMPLFQYLERHPEESRSFHESMNEITRRDAADILKVYPFLNEGTIVDIAGGEGTLLAAILKAAPNARGVLFELPQVIASARARLEAELLRRLELVEGDFFRQVPSGGDVYILKNILHDWDDERATAILRTCRKAMPRAARLLLIEGVVPTGNGPSPTKMMDVMMLIQVGGRERTEEEHRRLLAAGGFRLNRLVAASPTTTVLEAVPE